MVCVMSMLASCTQSPQEKLRRECAAANTEMPQDLGSSVIVRSVSYTDGNVVYHLTCDELFCPLYDEEYFEAVSEDMIREFENSTDQDIIELVRMCREANANIVYEYVSTQGNTYDIVIPL